MRYIYDIKFKMLQLRVNEISLRKCSGDVVQLGTKNEKLAVFPTLLSAK